MEKIITRKGHEGKLIFDDKNQRVLVKEGNVEYLITYIRDNKVKVKNDLILNDVDLARVRAYMVKFIKKEDVRSKKRK